jgi:response regulator RpfG family c-di-GMP phosphodiesterase
MRELRYAGLLHDFGKVAVREEVLVKAKKLPTLMQERVRARFELIEHALQAEFLRQKSEYLLECGRDGFDAFMGRLEREFSAERGRLERYRSAVIDANEPKLVPVEEERILQEIAGATFRDWKGGEIPYIKPEELHFLSIPRGSLDPGEREQIQSHVMYTYDFLRQIPWTEDLARVVDIAFAHHEALDGTGYPRGISGDQIPLQTRMMTVSDVFDALTASDRPYKKSIPAEDALDILRTEAAASRLDSAVVQVLVESRVYERILREDWRKL